MKIDIKTPNITQYFFQLEPEDELYTACMWAGINLDHDACTMTATSDCGYYTYHGYPGVDKTFVQLMMRISGDYLLSKISNEDVFDFGESKQAAIEEAEEYCPGRVDELKAIDECGEEGFLRDVNLATDWPYDEIPVVKHYPAWAETFVRIFTEYLQPLLREATP